MKEKRRLHIKIAFVHVLLMVGSLIIITPILYTALTAFKSQADVFNPAARLIPSVFHPENFYKAFQTAPFLRYFLNSLLVASTVTLANLFFCSLAGYSLAKFKYRGQKVFFLFIVATMVIPPTVLIVPLYTITKQLNWINSYKGLTIPLFVNAFGVFLMRQFIMGIPDEYMDAARIDGCSEFKIYYKVIFPLIKPALSFLAVYIFITNWNSFLWPLIIVSTDSLKTLPLGIMSFETTYYTLYNYIMVMASIAIIPPLILFALTQKYYVRMVAAGLKG